MKANIKYFLALGVIIWALIAWIYRDWQQKKTQDDITYLEKLYKTKEFRTIVKSTDELISRDKISLSNNFGLHYIRGAAYYKLGEFSKSLSDINIAIDINGKDDYFLYYMRAKLNDELKSKDTACICSNVTQAINVKGGIISYKNLKFNYMDTSNLFDVNYIDMLKLRVKYCADLMPDYVKLDKELLEKNE
ncbi:MAG: hypothetical protein WCK02_15000 [Bacteroidota bacterium]